MNGELKTIKNIYGEEMMHLCRELFPSLLEKEGLLLSILLRNLAPTHSFACDIKENDLYEEFKDWIYSFIDVEKDNLIITNKTPFELMDEVGYTLYECKTEEDIQSFKKYYAPNEVLCTISNGGRLNRCYVFFAIKKNVDEIKRENFVNPKRQDEYGTSVISIQFSKGKIATLSIKNRYNHSVNNPDATFSNNLENIILGLTKSFEQYYGLNVRQNNNLTSNFLIDELKYVKGNDGKYYRYNVEINGIYYCENNIIVQAGDVITKYRDNPERYILMEEYILDLKDKTIEPFDIDDRYDYSFVDSIYDVGKINKIEVTKNKDNKIVTFNYEEDRQVKIEIDKSNAIVGYENNHAIKIGHCFLVYNTKLSTILLSNVQIIEDSFLLRNEKLSSISLPKVEKIGNNFLYYNDQLSNISLPQVQIVGEDFLFFNEQLSSISLPCVKDIGSSFLYCNQQLSSISLPQVETIRESFMAKNNKLNSISLPQVETIGKFFLINNNKLNSISLPKVQSIGSVFLCRNNLIDKKKLFQEMEERHAQANNQRNI